MFRYNNDDDDNVCVKYYISFLYVIVIGLAAARVSALYDLVDEYHIDTERIKLNEILESEQL